LYLINFCSRLWVTTKASPEKTTSPKRYGTRCNQ